MVRKQSRPKKTKKFTPSKAGAPRSLLSRSHLFPAMFCVGLLLVCWLLFDLANLPDGSEFKTAVPSRTALMNDRIAAANANHIPYKLDFEWRARKAISPELARAVIIAEDAAFFDHDGFDWHEIGVVVDESIFTEKRTRGASTITQQLARNLYLGDSRSLLRKLREAVITYKMEQTLTKNRILELYLNIVEWGPGIFGAQAASKYHFGVSADALNSSQAATLAAILPNPLTVYNPKKNPARVEKRREMILNRIRRSRVIM